MPRTHDDSALAARNEALDNIAHQYLGLDTLETRRSDSRDFHDLAVWNVKAALEAAYAAGAKSAQGGR